MCKLLVKFIMLNLFYLLKLYAMQLQNTLSMIIYGGDIIGIISIICKRDILKASANNKYTLEQNLEMKTKIMMSCYYITFTHMQT